MAAIRSFWQTVKFLLRECRVQDQVAIDGERFVHVDLEGVQADDGPIQVAPR